jgi:hypothetical protein
LVSLSSLLIGLEVSPDGYEHFIEDLESTNRTYIGHYEYPLSAFKLYQLTDGKELTLGPLKCVYRYENSLQSTLGEHPESYTASAKVFIFTLTRI